MTDYINRDAVVMSILCAGKIGKQTCIDIIKRESAADVRPVVRGEWKTAWLDHEAFGERPRVFYCSACNQITTFRTLYCPNCGADMREEVQE